MAEKISDRGVSKGPTIENGLWRVEWSCDR